MVRDAVLGRDLHDDVTRDLARKLLL